MMAPDLLWVAVTKSVSSSPRSPGELNSGVGEAAAGQEFLGFVAYWNSPLSSERGDHICVGGGGGGGLLEKIVQFAISSGTFSVLLLVYLKYPILFSLTTHK